MTRGASEGPPLEPIKEDTTTAEPQMGRRPRSRPWILLLALAQVVSNALGVTAVLRLNHDLLEAQKDATFARRS